MFLIKESYCCGLGVQNPDVALDGVKKKKMKEEELKHRSSVTKFEVQRNKRRNCGFSSCIITDQELARLIGDVLQVWVISNAEQVRGHRRNPGASAIYRENQGRHTKPKDDQRAGSCQPMFFNAACSSYLFVLTYLIFILVQLFQLCHWSKRNITAVNLHFISSCMHTRL